MSSIRVASRYAKSILELAIEKGILEEVHQDMQLLLTLDKATPELGVMLNSPIVSSDKKLKILKALFPEGSSELTLPFFEIVSKKNRDNVLMEIAKEFHNQYNESKGIQLATVTTTFPIDEKLKKEFIEIVKEISGLEKVELIEKINPEIIGGFILKVNDRQLDESLNSKLKALRLEFSQNLYEKKF
ncbi:hypothetical protein P872_07095 [Rhodonellum psychrophilum GCM71 = DSM 17998]|uniref:ATP synthase subunit delta n=2 Tax=Rhodonellum TaxID=336827 RepID=U5C175_9BACT|nr:MULTISPECIES: ATP synthase F1 subunit delta [Rhodonellum]ERM81897.1 hypothetical protein P872_07095 [Rhodonellum psychrophilum GCM71 = DSM 17998]MDO9553646.1 ATP synthase F1 subunit delta [Rhodonellum sp.]SDY68225.1 ATP synthase F1 subcomplex delta subunit [Rhodonellum ikkaensis]